MVSGRSLDSAFLALRPSAASRRLQSHCLVLGSRREGSPQAATTRARARRRGMQGGRKVGCGRGGLTNLFFIVTPALVSMASAILSTMAALISRGCHRERHFGGSGKAESKAENTKKTHAKRKTRRFVPSYSASPEPPKRRSLWQPPEIRAARRPKVDRLELPKRTSVLPAKHAKKMLETVIFIRRGNA